MECYSGRKFADHENRVVHQTVAPVKLYALLVLLKGDHQYIFSGAILIFICFIQQYKTVDMQNYTTSSSIVRAVLLPSIQ